MKTCVCVSPLSAAVFVSGIAIATIALSASGAPLFMGLGDLPGAIDNSSATGVSADGSVVAGTGRTVSGNEAFRWTSGGGMVGLGDLAGGSFDSRARATSGDGSVVVGRGRSASGFEAFVWDATNGMRELDQILTSLGVDLTGWTLSEARSISADGLTIVGSGKNPSGENLNTSNVAEPAM